MKQPLQESKKVQGLKAHGIFEQAKVRQGIRCMDRPPNPEREKEKDRIFE